MVRLIVESYHISFPSCHDLRKQAASPAWSEDLNPSDFIGLRFGHQVMCLFVIGYLYHRFQTWVVSPWTQSKILFQWKFVYLTAMGLLRVKISNKMASLEDGWKSLLFVWVERVTSRLNLSTDKDHSWSSLWEDITLSLGWNSDSSVYKLPTSSPFLGISANPPGTGWGSLYITSAWFNTILCGGTLI